MFKKLQIAITCIVSIFFLFPCFAEAASGTQPEYDGYLNRVYGFIIGQSVFDAKCKKRFADGNDYDESKYQEWKQKNSDAIAEINSHYTAFVERISIEVNMPAQKVRMELDGMIYKMADAINDLIEKADAETARKACTTLANTLNKPETQIETKYSKELAIVRACRKDNRCPYLK